jgi:beta-lactamase superfamily II metal-dependent hydrolase
MIRSVVFLIVLLGLAALALPAARDLEVYVIDTEGGKAMLVVSPSGQSMLVDAGFPGYNGRDADRIAEAARAAGVRQFDYLVVTHYDLDHVANVPEAVSRIPARVFVDHGPNANQNPRAQKTVDAYLELADKAKRLTVKPGDKIPIEGLDVRVVTSDGKNLAAPLKGAGAPNQHCAGVVRKQWPRGNEDVSENAMSIGLLYTYGNFRMLDLADLTWNKELALMCPVNPIGTVDLFMVSHHGMDISNSPALVHALQPRVAVMNNGAKKGGAPAGWQAVRSSPGLEDLWQLHYSIPGGAQANSPEEFIANLEGGPDGKWIKVSAQQNGGFTVTNGRTGTPKMYKRRK